VIASYRMKTFTGNIDSHVVSYYTRGKFDVVQQLHFYNSIFVDGIQYLVDLLKPDFNEPDSNRGRPIPLELQILVTLRYLGTGDLQNTIADTVGLSQPSVSRCIERVCSALVDKIAQFVSWPTNESKQKEDFKNIAGFPCVVGVIDGSHIRIQEPKDNPNAYINRKHFPSMNICAVCDAQCKFIFLSVRWPGSCHDSFILRQTQLWDAFENNDKRGIILADSAYPCRKWLLTPYPHPQTTWEEAYNKALTSTRVRIECAFGRLKKRFRALHCELRVTPSKAPLIISACVILQNIAIDFRMPHFDSDDDGIFMEDDDEIAATQTSASNGFEFRNYVAETYFS
jgi:hypothetical protein